MALIRAFEFLKLPEKRLFSDPYARQFVPAYQRALLGAAHLLVVRVLLEGYFDWRVPGARTFGAAQCRASRADRRTAIDLLTFDLSSRR